MNEVGLIRARLWHIWGYGQRGDYMLRWRKMGRGEFMRESALREEWAHQDSNLGPSDYESDALTN